MGKNINDAKGKKQDLRDGKNNKIGRTKKAHREGMKRQTTGNDPVRTQRLAVLGLLQKLERAKNAPKEDRVLEPSVEYYIGIDLGDKKSHYFILDKNGNVAANGSMSTTTTDVDAHFKAIPRSRIALEVGTHSPWVSALLEAIGHEVYVANPRKMDGGKRKNRKKNDPVDAERLARQGKSDPKLLYPIQHRSQEARRALVLLRARHALVGARTKLICSLRGLVKSDGYRLPRCSADSFHKMPRTNVPQELRESLEPMFEQVEFLTERIKKYEAMVNRLCRDEYPECEIFRQVDGVGLLTSYAYRLTIEDPERFAKSRDVGPYVGLVPKQHESGDSSPELRITKTGDRMLRELLVECAQHMLSRRGKDSDLRRQGLKLAARGKKNAKKRAIVAVARKTAVLLHRLWVTGEAYEPLRNSLRAEKVA